MSRFTISSANNLNSIFVHDSKDNSRERYSLKQLQTIQKAYPSIKLDGLDRILKMYKHAQTIDKQGVADYVLHKFREYDASYCMDNVEIEDFRVTVSVRDWGEWVYPPYINGDEIEDYDWMIPSPALSSMLNKVRADIRAKYPNYRITADSGEKSWVYINIDFVYI